MDTISKKRRSANMARIRSKNTRPELLVRRMAHALGYRYRLHNSKLPGKPDLVFTQRGKIIFVHGCFWHLHPSSECLDARKPKSNKSYWHPKLERNAARDAEHLMSLTGDGWKVLVIWDCETRDSASLRKTLLQFLGSRKRLQGKPQKKIAKI